MLTAVAVRCVVALDSGGIFGTEGNQGNKKSSHPQDLK